MNGASAPSPPRITLVVAVATNGVIGRDGALPWRLSTDLRRFKAATLGKPIVMGRKTFESIGRALPGRHNIVLTRSLNWQASDPAVSVVPDWSAVLAAAGPVAEIMVIGGAEIYALALPFAERILLTEVQGEVHGDTRFPPLDRSRWLEVSSEGSPADEHNSHAVRFVELVRRTA